MLVPGVHDRTDSCPRHSVRQIAIRLTCWRKSSWGGTGRGERPALAEYIEGHPELAEQIQELFPSLLLMEQVKPAEGNLALRGGRFRAAVDAISDRAIR